AQLTTGASADQADDPAVVFWNAEATREATGPLTETRSPERGPALIQLVTTPTAAARQCVWKYLKLNETKGPGDFLAIGVGEKLMPDPSLIISVKSLASPSGRRKDLPLSSAITFAVAGNTTQRTGTGYPGTPAPVVVPPGTATDELVKPAAQLAGRTCWAAFSDYLRHWTTQRFIADDLEGTYTRVPAGQRPYELPPDAEIMNEYRCVLPVMIPENKKNTLKNAKISVDPTYVYFVRFRCSERGTNTRISFYNGQLKKNGAEGDAPATETFLGTGYWLDWIGSNPKTGYPRSVDVYIRPEQNAFDREQPLAILATTTQRGNTPGGYGRSVPTPSGGGRAGSRPTTGGDPILGGLLGFYMGPPIPNYQKASPTALIVDVLVVECRASAEPPKRANSGKAAKNSGKVSGKTEKTPE
ncbi:MAG: hypothetical protein Q4C47_09695, partial [Planctomycetia bacterium]|nr:hypothetical protein [Planctomycetia bacterium]